MRAAVDRLLNARPGGLPGLSGASVLRGWRAGELPGFRLGAIVFGCAGKGSPPGWRRAAGRASGPGWRRAIMKQSGDVMAAEQRGDICRGPRPATASTGARRPAGGAGGATSPAGQRLVRVGWTGWREGRHCTIVMERPATVPP